MYKTTFTSGIVIICFTIFFIFTYSGAYPFNFRWRIQSQNRVKLPILYPFIPLKRNKNGKNFTNLAHIPDYIRSARKDYPNVRLFPDYIRSLFCKKRKFVFFSGACPFTFLQKAEICFFFRSMSVHRDCFLVLFLLPACHFSGAYPFTHLKSSTIFAL